MILSPEKQKQEERNAWYARMCDLWLNLESHAKMGRNDCCHPGKHQDNLKTLEDILILLSHATQKYEALL